MIDLRGIRELDPSFRVPPTSEPVPVNANVVQVLATAGGAVLILFDIPVIVDPATPVGWFYGDATTILPGCLNFGTASYLVVSSAVGIGDSVTITDSEPGARTVERGYVNGVARSVSAG